MKLKHPTENKTAVVRYGSLRAHQLIQAGWQDITPRPTLKQLAATKKWQRLGTLTRIVVNISHELQQDYNPSELLTLREAQIVLTRKLLSLREGVDTPNNIGHNPNTVRKQDTLTAFPT